MSDQYSNTIGRSSAATALDQDDARCQCGVDVLQKQQGRCRAQGHLPGSVNLETTSGFEAGEAQTFSTGVFAANVPKARRWRREVCTHEATASLKHHNALDGLSNKHYHAAALIQSAFELWNRAAKLSGPLASETRAGAGPLGPQLATVERATRQLSFSKLRPSVFPPRAAPVGLCTTNNVIVGSDGLLCFLIRCVLFPRSLQRQGQAQQEGHRRKAKCSKALTTWQNWSH